MGTTYFLPLWSKGEMVSGIKQKTGTNRQQLLLPLIFCIFCKYYPLGKIYFCKI